MSTKLSRRGCGLPRSRRQRRRVLDDQLRRARQVLEVRLIVGARAAARILPIGSIVASVPARALILRCACAKLVSLRCMALEVVYAPTFNFKSHLT